MGEFREHDRVCRVSDLTRMGTVTAVLGDGSPRVRFDGDTWDTLVTPYEVAVVDRGGVPRC